VVVSGGKKISGRDAPGFRCRAENVRQRCTGFQAAGFICCGCASSPSLIDVPGGTSLVQLSPMHNLLFGSGIPGLCLLLPTAAGSNTIG